MNLRKIAFVLILLLALSFNVTAYRIISDENWEYAVVDKELTSQTFQAGDSIYGLVGVSFRKEWILDSNFEIDSNFLAKAGSEYKASYRAIRLITTSECIWYGILQIVEDGNLQVLRVLDTKRYSAGGCYSAKNLPEFTDTEVYYSWSEKYKLLEPDVNLEADIEKGYKPLTVNFTGACNALTETAGVTVCEIDYGYDSNNQRVKEDFNQGTSTHKFEKDGNYSVVLKVIDSYGEKKTKTVNVEVKKKFSKLLNFSLMDANPSRIVFRLGCSEKTQATLKLMNSYGNEIVRKTVDCPIVIENQPDFNAPDDSNIQANVGDSNVQTDLNEQLDANIQVDFNSMQAVDPSIMQIDVNLGPVIYRLNVQLEDCDANCSKRIEINLEEPVIVEEKKPEGIEVSEIMIIIGLILTLLVVGIILYEKEKGVIRRALKGKKQKGHKKKIMHHKKKKKAESPLNPKIN